jgi:hypothetical protein
VKKEDPLAPSTKNSQAGEPRSKEMQEKLDAFHKEIGKALVENLNRNVLKEAEADRAAKKQTYRSGAEKSVDATSWQTIVKVGAEGGSVTLYGQPSAQGWLFSRTVNDQTPLMLDQSEIRHSSSTVADWAEALILLDKYPWASLVPIKVHPGFAEQILAAVSQRIEESGTPTSRLKRWKHVCDASLGVSSGHRLAPLIMEGIREPLFAARWNDGSDESFRAFAVAVIELRDAQRLPAASRGALFRDLCMRKRSEILSDILDKPIASRVLKVLSRTDWKDFARGDWDALFSLLIREGENSVLGHVHRFTPIFVRQFALIPEELRVPQLLNVVSNLFVPAQRWEQLRLFLEKADAGQRAEMLRAAATIESKGEFWDFYFRCEGKYWLPFDFPSSISTSELLEPIASPLQMQAEGLCMNNCLANRVSRVLSGNRIYFRLLDNGEVNAELVRRVDGWVPGDILGRGNSVVPADTAEKIRTELQRLAKTIPITAESSISAHQDACIERLLTLARKSFSEVDIVELAGPLRSIQGRSQSWTKGAFTVIEMDSGEFIQFMCSPDGKEYLCEICSHKYNDDVNEVLTADIVDLIEECGFVWPIGKDNFLRWFNVSSEEDVHAMAELALSILGRVFGHRKGLSLTIRTHIPD